MSEVVIKNKRINYIQEGKGLHTILLLHGWGGSMESLRSLFDFLKEDNQCVMLDLPGFGKSDNPGPDWGIGEYADLVVGFLNKLDLKKVVLFGHSYGGAVGVYIAANYPLLIEKIILSAPSYRREKHHHQHKKTFWKKIKRFTKIPIYDQAIHRLIPLRKFFYRVFYPDSDILKYPKLESNFRKIVTQDLTDLLPNIQQKTLILWGDLDSYVPLEHAYILKSKVTNSKLEIYEGAGHGLPKFQPKWVYMKIEKFIKED